MKKKIVGIIFILILLVTTTQSVAAITHLENIVEIEDETTNSNYRMVRIWYVSGNGRRHNDGYYGVYFDPINVNYIGITFDSYWGISVGTGPVYSGVIWKNADTGYNCRFIGYMGYIIIRGFYIVTL